MIMWGIVVSLSVFEYDASYESVKTRKKKRKENDRNLRECMRRVLRNIWIWMIWGYVFCHVYNVLAMYAQNIEDDV